MTATATKEINPRFEEYLFDWNQTYQFLVGGYGSSKSYNTGLKVIKKLLEEKRKMLIVREVYDTHRDSTFSLLQDIVEELGLSDYILFINSPMQVRFPNGSKIIFKGMDKPEKLKSINNVSLIWIEEASEVKYAGFKELTGRLRHPYLKLHMILSTNPVGQDNWTYRHFFKDELNKRFVLDDQELYKKKTVVVGDTYYHYSTADDNLFLPKSYIKQLEDMKEYDPDLYRIARLGHFGINGKRVLPQFEVKNHHEVMNAILDINNPIKRVGMDFGFEQSYNAVLRMAVDPEKYYLYIYWEYYTREKTDPEIAEDLAEFKETQELIKADYSDSKSIKYFRDLGFNMIKTYKFQGSRTAYTKKVKRFRKIICSDRCTNTIFELKDLTYAVDKKTGNIIEDEFKIDPHTFSAMWYGLDDYNVTDIKDQAKEKARKRPRRERR